MKNVFSLTWFYGTICIVPRQGNHQAKTKSSYLVVSGDERSKNFVAGDGQGLGEEIGQVPEPRNEDDAELPLVDAIA